MNIFSKSLRTTFTVSVAALMLSGCSGSSGSAQPSSVKSDSSERAQLLELSVSGLRYTSENSSGLTDDAGNFEYTAGQPLTFSIGDIELGTFTFNETPSLFESTIASLPATRNQLLAEIQHSNDVTDFDRAINILTLLAILDQDGTLANGIQLEGLDNILVDTGINFDQPMSKFNASAASRLLAGRYGGSSYVDYLDIIALVYGALDIAIEGEIIRKLTVHTTIQDGSSQNPASVSAVYDFDYSLTNDNRQLIDSRAHTENGISVSGTDYVWSQGNVVSYERDSADGSKELSSRDYDSSQIISDTYSHSDGTSISETTTYNDFGQVDYSEQSVSLNNVQHSVRSISHQYDDQQRLTGQSFSDNGVIRVHTNLYEGNSPLKTSVYIDFGGDGTNEMTQRFAYQNGVLSTIETAAQIDSKAELIEAYQHYPNGNLRSITTEQLNNDSYSVVRTETFAYDQTGNLELHEVQETLPNMDIVSSIITSEFTHGNHLASRTEKRFLNDDTAPYYSKNEEFSYAFQTVDNGILELLSPQVAQLPE